MRIWNINGMNIDHTYRLSIYHFKMATVLIRVTKFNVPNLKPDGNYTQNYLTPRLTVLS